MNATVKAYAVTGCTGQYSYYEDWVVCAYLSKAKADAHIARLLQAALDCGASDESPAASWDVRRAAVKAFSDGGHDPCFSYGGFESSIGYFMTEFDIDLETSAGPAS